MIARAFIAPLALAAALHAQTWSHDASHSSVGFSIKHLAVSTVRGEFDKVEGSLVGDPAKPATLRATVTIQAASVNTKSEARDNHLRNEDFFDVAKYPVITFMSDKAEFRKDTLWFSGILTMHGVAKRVSIPFTLSGPVQDPWNKTRLGLEGAFTLDRTNWGVSGGVPAVGKEVKVEISAEFVRNP